MACGAPVVIRAAASANEMVTPGHDGCVEDTVPGFTAALAALIGNPSRRAEAGRNAAKTADERFRWHHTMAGVRAAYAEAVAAHRR